MARTTDTYVKEVMAAGNDYDTLNNPSLTRYITHANLLTTRVNECATDRGYTLSETELLEIETLMAAFFYQMSDKGYTSRSTLRGSGSFHGQWGMYIDSNNYGQAAIMLDPSGCLAAIGRGASARIKWLGKAPSGQTNYVDRD